MGSPLVGYATLQVIPSTKGFAAAVTGQTSGAIAAAGRKGGEDGGKAAGLGLLAGIKGMLGPIAAVTGGLAIFGAVKDAIKDSISLASDLAEQVNVIDVTFGAAAKQINDFAATGPKALGMSKLAAQQAAAEFGLFGKMAGLTGSSLVDFSTDLTKLSVDLASFRNAEPAEVVTALGAALRGEAEPARRFGILLDDMTLRTEAVRQGIIKTTKQALTPQQRVLAAHAVIMRQTTDAQGDFARTSSGLANQQRILAAQWEDLKTRLGAHLLPVVNRITGAFVRLLDSASGAGAKLAPLAGAVATLRHGLRNLFGGEEDAASAFGEDLDRLTGDTGRHINAFEALGDVVLSVKNLLIDGGRAFADAFGPVRPLIDELRAAFQDRFTVILDILSDLAPAFANLSRDGVPVMRTLGEAARVGAEFMIASFKATTEAIRLLWKVFGPSTVANVKTTMAAVWGILGGTFQAIKGGFQVLKALFTGDWPLLWTGVKNVFVGSWKATFALLEGTGKLLAGLIGRIWAPVAKVWRDGWDSLVSFVSAIPGRVSAFVQQLPTLIGNGLRTALYTVGFMAGAIVRTLTVDMPARIVSGLAALWSTATTVVANGAAATVAWFGRFVTDAKAFVDALPARIWATLQNLWTGAQTRVRDGIAAVVAHFRRLPTDASAAASSLPQRIWEALLGAVDRARSIGINVIQGVIDGIKSMTGRLGGVVKDIAGLITKGFKDALGIKSPSRVFKALGGFLMQGAAIGITQGSPQVMRAMNAVSDGLARTQLGVGVGAGANRTAAVAAAAGISVERLEIKAYSDRFSLRQVQDDLALHGVH